ncbi:hypothetical protein BH09CHL1_BH09CHL1_32730 [soil metagenome]
MEVGVAWVIGGIGKFVLPEALPPAYGHHSPAAVGEGTMNPILGFTESKRLVAIRNHADCVPSPTAVGEGWRRGDGVRVLLFR